MDHLRPYQAEGKDKIFDAWDEGHQIVLLIGLTGSGKTTVFVSVVADFVDAGMRVCIEVHRDKLIAQTFETLVERGGLSEERIGIQAGGYPSNPHRPVQICSQQTLARRPKWKEQRFDLYVLDECHQTGFNSVGKATIELVRQRGARMLPVTATPFRNLPREGYEWCDTQVNLPGFEDLRSLGFICQQIRYYGLPKAAVSLKGIKTSMGDYATGELSNVCSDPQVIDSTIDSWLDLSPGRRSMAFCVDLAHCEAVRSRFEARGIPALSITGDTPRKERDAIAKKVEDREALVLCSVGALSEGADFPFMETALMLRPTKSKALAIQQLGRIARPFQYPDSSWKTALVLDQAGVVASHGFLEDLPGDLRRQMPREPGPTKGEGSTTKLCEKCDCICRVFDKECPACGHLFSEKTADTSKLVELVRQGEKNGKPLSDKAKTDKMRRRYQSLRKEAHKRSLLPGWAYHRFKREFSDQTPQREWDRNAVFSQPTPGKVHIYWTYLDTLAARKGLADPQSFIEKEMDREFGAGPIAGQDWHSIIAAA